jgi:lipoate-protein ligase A
MRIVTDLPDLSAWPGKVTREPGWDQPRPSSPVVARERTITVLRDNFDETPALDTAIARALLNQVSDGAAPESLRLHRPASVVAFGRQDIVQPGYAAAVMAARRQGFAGVERLGGGRAAVFHPGTLSFAWTIPDPSPRDRIRQRFQELAEIMAAAFIAIGIDARIGEVPGEYCPGDYSVNAGGRRKLMGVGQRVAAHASHVGGVVVVHEASRVRNVLLPVYEALGIEWDPDTTGSVENEVPGVTMDDVANAILVEFARRYPLISGQVSQETVVLARGFEPEHRSPE